MNNTIRYTIRPYDTIWMLAQVFNTSVDDIMELNPDIDPRNLRIGQVVTLIPGDHNYSSYPNQQNNSDNNMNNNMGTNMSNNIGTNMGNNMGTNMGANMGNNMGANMGNSMGTNMGNNMGTNMGTNMGNNMSNNMGTNMGNNMSNNMGSFMDNYMDDDMDNVDYYDLSSLFRMLWVQHVYWTRMAVMSLIHDLPETDLVLRRLLRNSVDFANALRPYYGDEAAVEFTDLMNGHITIAGELVNALLADNDQAIMDTDQRWHDNAEQIAEFFASINPNWSVEDWSAMMNEHLELLSQNITNMIAGNYEESINDFDNIESQAVEMADMMAEGIEAQFPD
ncbi:MAG: LysM domain-containing protein [Mobilitalea sp.]